MRVGSFVAIGDSLTEGVGDPQRGGYLLGWADRLAARLRVLNPELAYLNLGVNGLRSGQVRSTQLQRALDAEPDLVSILVGANDAFVASVFDLEQVTEQIRALVEPFTATGATVLMGTLPDFTANRWRSLRSRVLLGAPTGLQERIEQVNAAIRMVADESAAVLLDLDGDPRVDGRGIWSLDGVHPTGYGHAVIADAFATALGLPGEPPPLPPVPVRLVASGRQARWLGRIGVAWVRGRYRFGQQLPRRPLTG